MEEEVKYSKKDYTRLGERLRQLKSIDEAGEKDLVMLQALRNEYKQPLAEIFNAIKPLAYKCDRNCVCTYRVKRIESIFSKLKRQESMKLPRFEDIAGCRFIMSSEEEVYKLVELINKHGSSYNWVLPDPHDYIANPKDTGYKSYHMYVQLPADSRRLEIQIRTLEQHNWATMVEITDQVYHSKIKEIGAQSNEELYKLHYLLSKGNNALTKKEKEELASVVMKYDYVNRIGGVFMQNYVNVRSDWNDTLKKCKGNQFVLISTGSNNRPEFRLFSTFSSAEDEYFSMFQKNNGSKNIVLAHAQDLSFRKVSIAYSNYFMTYNSLLIRILDLFSESVIATYKSNSVIKFKKFYEYYMNTALTGLMNEMKDYAAFAKENKKAPNTRTKLKDEWNQSIEDGMNAILKQMVKMEDKLTFSPTCVATFMAKKFISRKSQEEHRILIKPLNH